MQQLNKTVENLISLVSNTYCKAKKNPLVFSGALLILVIVTWQILFSTPEQPKQSMQMQMAMHMKTFGPGDSYHVHKAVNQANFERVANINKAANDLPPPLARNASKTVEIKLVAQEVISDIAPVTSFHYWTFNKTVPGPFLRIRVGDTVKLSLQNDKSSTHDHSIDLHAVTGPGGGAALTEVEPGKTKTMQFKALNPGLFVYHCAAGNAPTHITMGMYGLILVEPEGGLSPVDKEFYIMQGELYTKGMMGERGFQSFDGSKMIAEQPEYIFFNGRPWSLVENGKMKAKVGEQVRLFVGNGGVAKISSFHVIGEIFDRVYPEASTSRPLENVQTTLIPAGGAVMTEIQLDVPGDYVLVDHALTRIDRGAWGILNVSGKKDQKIFSPAASLTGFQN